jgi:hypothetical protein
LTTPPEADVELPLDPVPPDPPEELEAPVPR